MMVLNRKRKYFYLSVILALGSTGITGWAQTYAPMPPAPAPIAPMPLAPPMAPAPPAAPSAYPIAPPVPAQVPQLSDAQLGDLTASIALYPDPLLGAMLPAATYPLDVVGAKQWLDAHPNPDEGTIDALPDQPAVKTLIHYPSVLGMMSDHLDWTQALGAAVTYQQGDVFNSIQRWRGAALADGALVSTPQQQIVNAGGVIQILPAVPETVYVPVYDPAVVFVGHPHDGIRFEAAGRFGGWLDFDLDWHDRVVRVPDHPWWERPNVDDHQRWNEMHQPATVVRDSHGPAVVSPPAAPALERHAFVRGDDKRPTFPDRVIVPQPDHKVVTIPGGHGPAPDARGGPGPGDRGGDRRADDR